MPDYLGDDQRKTKPKDDKDDDKPIKGRFQLDSKYFLIMSYFQHLTKLKLHF